MSPGVGWVICGAFPVSTPGRVDLDLLDAVLALEVGLVGRLQAGLADVGALLDARNGEVPSSFLEIGPISPSATAADVALGIVAQADLLDVDAGERVGMLAQVVERVGADVVLDHRGLIARGLLAVDDRGDVAGRDAEHAREAVVEREPPGVGGRLLRASRPWRPAGRPRRSRRGRHP